MQRAVIYEYASRESLKEYSRYKRRGLPLKCPCNFSKGCEVLNVVKKLSKDLVLLQPEKHPTQLTLAVISDLKYIETEDS